MNPVEILDALGEAGPVGALLKRKHAEYVVKAKRYAKLYYATRAAAGFSAAGLPFTTFAARGSQFFADVSIALAVIIVFTTTADFIWNPKDRWVLFSKATDLLTLAAVRRLGSYDDYKELLDVLVRTESANLERLVDVKELVQQVREVSAPH